MTGRASTPKKQGPTPTHGVMEPPATPRTGNRGSTRAPDATPANSGDREAPAHPHTPQLPPDGPVEELAELTPGGSERKVCTIAEPEYKRVKIHTAKCTQCDLRNDELMRRCAGCTFQICQPCYDKRLKEGVSLLHGNMPVPGTPQAAAEERKVRTPRKRLDATTPGGRPSKMSEKIKHEDIAAEEKPTPPAKSTAKKRAPRKPKVADSEPEMSSEDDFNPEDDGSPVAKKRRRTELTFAESAATNTMLKSPPARRATRGKSLPDPATSERRERPPELSEADIRKSVGVRPSEIPFEEMLQPRDRIDELMRAHGVGHYDEHLLGRQQPVVSNPVALIPPIIQRGGAPRRQPGETYARLQEQVRAKLSDKQVKHNVKYAQEETARNLAEQKKKWEEDGYPNTVKGYVEKEAHLHMDEDEDEFDDFLKSLESTALLWARRTYKKLSPTELRMVKPKWEMRLDLIDRKYWEELADLLEDCWLKWNEDPSEDGPSTAPPALAPPERQFTQA